jgi:hypothetical protein
MQVIIFSWEYPPRIVGKLSGEVKELSTKLALEKVDVNLVTYDNVPSRTVDASGVRVFRVSNPVRTHNGVLTWVLTLNQEVERAAADAYYEADKQIDVIDAYDWHFIPAAVTLYDGLNIPFVFSVESLEDHRSNFANNAYNMTIKSIEWLGFYEAKTIFVKTQWMLNEIVRIYKVPKEKIKIVSSAPQDRLAIYDSLAGGNSAK